MSEQNQKICEQRNSTVERCRSIEKLKRGIVNSSTSQHTRQENRDNSLVTIPIDFRGKLSLTNEQKSTLEQACKNNLPQNTELFKQLAKELDLPLKTVRNWFHFRKNSNEIATTEDVENSIELLSAEGNDYKESGEHCTIINENTLHNGLEDKLVQHEKNRQESNGLEQENVEVEKVEYEVNQGSSLRAGHHLIKSSLSKVRKRLPAKKVKSKGAVLKKNSTSKIPYNEAFKENVTSSSSSSAAVNLKPPKGSENDMIVLSPVKEAALPHHQKWGNTISAESNLLPPTVQVRRCQKNNLKKQRNKKHLNKNSSAGLSMQNCDKDDSKMIDTVVYQLKDEILSSTSEIVNTSSIDSEKSESKQLSSELFQPNQNTSQMQRSPPFLRSLRNSPAKILRNRAIKDHIFYNGELFEKNNQSDSRNETVTSTPKITPVSDSQTRDDYSSSVQFDSPKNVKMKNTPQIKENDDEQELDEIAVPINAKISATPTGKTSSPRKSSRSSTSTPVPEKRKRNLYYPKCCHNPDNQDSANCSEINTRRSVRISSRERGEVKEECSISEEVDTEVVKVETEEEISISEKPADTGGIKILVAESVKPDPGFIRCHICHSCRYYKFRKQARVYKIFACESCRKFFFKLKRLVLGKTPTNIDASLQCITSEGKCQIDQQHLKSCPACYLKRCLRVLKMPAEEFDKFLPLLPEKMRNELQALNKETNNDTSTHIIETSIAVPSDIDYGLPVMLPNAQKRIQNSRKKGKKKFNVQLNKKSRRNSKELIRKAVENSYMMKGSGESSFSDKPVTSTKHLLLPESTLKLRSAAGRDVQNVLTEVIQKEIDVDTVNSYPPAGSGESSLCDKPVTSTKHLLLSESTLKESAAGRDVQNVLEEEIQEEIDVVTVNSYPVADERMQERKQCLLCSVHFLADDSVNATAKVYSISICDACEKIISEMVNRAKNQTSASTACVLECQSDTGSCVLFADNRKRCKACFLKMFLSHIDSSTDLFNNLTNLLPMELRDGFERRIDSEVSQCIDNPENVNKTSVTLKDWTKPKINDKSNNVTEERKICLIKRSDFRLSPMKLDVRETVYGINSPKKSKIGTDTPKISEKNNNVPATSHNEEALQKSRVLRCSSINLFKVGEACDQEVFKEKPSPSESSQKNVMKRVLSDEMHNVTEVEESPPVKQIRSDDTGESCTGNVNNSCSEDTACTTGQNIILKDDPSA